MMSQMTKLSPAAIWRVFRRQSWAFWLLCLYFLFEYVRPQSIYPVLNVVPWAQFTLVACLIAALVEEKIRVSVPLVSLVAAYAIIVLLSVIGAYETGAALRRWDLIVNWLLVFFLTVTIVDREERFFIFMFLFLLWNLKMSQHAARSWAMAGFGFRDWGVTGAPGWFHNSGEFGIQMTMFFPLSAYFLWHCWRDAGTLARGLLVAMPVTCVLGTIATASRGAYLGLAAALLVFLVQARRPKIVAAVVGLTAIGALMVPSQQWQRFSTAGSDGTSQARLTYWEDGIEIMNRHPLLGVGYDNWLEYYRDHYSGYGLDSSWQEPHNIFIEAGAELGYSGLLTFILLIFGTFAVNRRTRRVGRSLGTDGEFLRKMAYGLDAALVGYLVSGFFVTVLYYPYFWVNLSMTVALHLSARDTLSRAKIHRGATPTATAKNAVPTLPG